MVGSSHPPELVESVCRRIHAGEYKAAIEAETRISHTTLLKYYRRWCKDNNIEPSSTTVYKKTEAAAVVMPPMPDPPQGAKILIYDIETLPNLGYFWDTFSDRSIPIDFVLKPKSICTIAYKWYGQPETYVLVMDKPYDDSSVLEAFLPEWSKADYVVAHYSRFDKPFIAARLMANGLPSLPPVNDICTYKLAKQSFGRSLNGNKLDHLGTILGVGNKIKTSADLWVGCAAGDKEAIRKMAEYNKQDVDLLAEVFKAMLPYVKSKLNLNLLVDDPVLRCKPCGSDKLEQRGFEFTTAAMRHRFICLDCNSWSTFSSRQTT